jgi:hypothetical protein
MGSSVPPVVELGAVQRPPIALDLLCAQGTP